MNKQLEDLNKACRIAEKVGVEILKKSHVKAYTRADGSQVAEHEDSRQAHTENQEDKESRFHAHFTDKMARDPKHQRLKSEFETIKSKYNSNTNSASKMDMKSGYNHALGKLNDYRSAQKDIIRSTFK